jgi:hypothetical protein
VLWDEPNQTLFAARDRFGIKEKVGALLDRLPDMDAGERTAVDGTLMMLLSACVLHQRFELGA